MFRALRLYNAGAAVAGGASGADRDTGDNGERSVSDGPISPGFRKPQFFAGARGVAGSFDVRQDFSQLALVDLHCS